MSARFTRVDEVSMPRQLLAALTSLLVAACIPVPVPWVSHGAVDRQKVEALQVGVATRTMVSHALGVPTLMRGDGRFWVYRWSEGRGRLIAVWLAPIGDYDQGALYDKEFVLFFEFDDQSVVRRREFVSGAAQGKDDSFRAFCMRDGTCLEQSRLFALDEWGLNIQQAMSPNDGNVVLSGPALHSAPLPVPHTDECVLVVWPRAEDWNAVGGLAASSAPPRTGRLTWVPPGAFVALTAPAGDGVLEIRNSKAGFDELTVAGSRSSAARYHCDSGQTCYLEIVKAASALGGLAGAELQPVEATVAQHAIDKMKRALPPWRG